MHGLEERGPLGLAGLTNELSPVPVVGKGDDDGQLAFTTYPSTSPLCFNLTINLTRFSIVKNATIHARPETYDRKWRQGKKMKKKN